MGLFDFLKPKPKNLPEYIEGIGEMTYFSKNNWLEYKGNIQFKDFTNKIETLFLCNESKISDYQKKYFDELNNNLKNLIVEASKKPDSRIDLMKYRIESIVITDKDYKSYDVDCEIVVTQLDNKKSKDRSIYSIIVQGMAVEAIIII